MTKDYKFINIIYTQFLRLAKSIKKNKNIPYELKIGIGFGRKKYYTYIKKYNIKPSDPNYMESPWERYERLPNFKEIEKNRKEALKLRAWLWWNYSDEEMHMKFLWLGRWKRPTKEGIEKIDIYLKKKYGK